MIGTLSLVTSYGVGRFDNVSFDEAGTLKRLDAAFVSDVAAPMPPGRNERLFWLPLLRCDPFGADAPKGGYNRRYQAWLGEALLQPEEAATAAMMDADAATAPLGKKRAAPSAASSAGARRYSPPAYCAIARSPPWVRGFHNHRSPVPSTPLWALATALSTHA